MPSWLMTHAGEGQAMPTEERIRLVEGVEIEGRPDDSGARWVYQQVRDEHLFDRRWLAQLPQLREHWRRALLQTRVRFYQKLARLEVA